MTTTRSSRSTWLQAMLRPLAAVAVGGACAAAGAQEGYPAKPITLVVPFAPGGGSDNVARLVASKIAERTGKTVIVDNRPGAGTNIGNEYAARATPDGYTLLFGQFTLSVNPYLYSHLRYSVERDFAPVALIASTPTVLVVAKASPVKDVAGLLSMARARPGQLSYGSGGAGTPPHLSGELLRSTARIDALHVAYKGSGPAVTDLIGGQIDFMIDTSTAVLPLIKGGRIRPVAVAAGSRLSALPDVPTFAEQGQPGFDVLAWYGLLAPTGTPDGVVKWLNAEVNAVLRDASVRARLDEVGAQPAGGSPADMAAFMKVQSQKWGKVIQGANIRLE